MSRWKGGKAMTKNRPGPGAAPVARRPLPGRGAVRLHLIARDPHCLFVAWRFSPAVRKGRSRAAAAADIPEGRLALRVYDVSHGPSPSRRFWQFFVGTRNSFYVSVPGSGRRYRAELGWAVGSAFVPLARSRAVETPPSGPAPAARKGAPDLAKLLPDGLGSLPGSQTLPGGSKGRSSP